MKLNWTLTLASALLLVTGTSYAQEHATLAANEHGGEAAKEHDEHGGKPAKKEHDEHGGEAAEEHDEHGGEPAKEKKKKKKDKHEHGGSPAEHSGQAVIEQARAGDSFHAEDIKAATLAYIESRSGADGTFRIRDNGTGELLTLKLEQVHDPVRRIDGDTYFACTDFSVVGEDGKLYDLDFWLRPESGELAVYDEKIHKEPRKSLLYGWYKQPRYTFVDDEVVSLY